MTVAMQFRLGPGRACRRDGRQRLQEGLFRFIEPLEWPLARATVYPVSRLVPNPGLQLLIGVRQAMELAQRHEVALDMLDACLDAALLGGVRHRTGVDHEGVAKSEFPVGPLHGRLVVAGTRDGAFRVIDANFARHAVEPLEGVTVTGQPGFDALIPNQLGVLVSAPGQGHDEEPGLEDFVGVPVGDQRS